MARLIAPNDTMREVEIQGARTGYAKRYRWGRDGVVNVESRAHEKALREAGFTSAGVPGAVSGGRTCKACGFKSWFVKCSRCGGECHRG